MVARELVGKYLVRRYEGVTLAVRLTETEAYIGRMDKACHAWNYRRTPRTQTLFAPPGTAYVYLIYGLHCCLNLVTEGEGEPAAVLLRGAVPRYNSAIIAENRFGRKEGSAHAISAQQPAQRPGQAVRRAARRPGAQRPTLGQRGAVCLRLSGRGGAAGLAGGRGPPHRPRRQAHRH